MPPYEILPEMVLRTPALPLNANQSSDKLQQWLDHPAFRSALYLASQSIYRELTDKNFQTPLLSPKTRQTLQKYLNRASHRTTPFGAFSAFSLISTNGPERNLTRQETSTIMHLDPDQAEINYLHRTYQDNGRYTIPVRTNGSLYRTPADLRYLYTEEKETPGLQFSIRKAERDRSVEQILQRCQKAMHPGDLLRYLIATFEMEEAESRQFFEALYEQQLLIPVAGMTLTGANAYERILEMSGMSRLFPKQLNERQLAVLPLTTPSSYRKPGQPITYYANLQYAFSGNLSPAIREDLEDALYALRKLSRSAEPSALSVYREAFIRRFDRQAVPVMEALDPETGISYDGLTGPKNENALYNGLDTGRVSGEPPLEWNGIQQMLIANWPGADRAPITLNRTQLESLPDHPDKVPPSFSLLFRIYKDQLQIDQGGGNSATALAGRFTPFDNALYTYSRKIARKEAAANPGVIFAEINHIMGDPADNISRREQVRDYEIPLLSSSLLPEEKQLRLSDLYLYAEQGELRLWSKKLQKRIIPRLSSAYNHQRSDLAAFRLLTDLQYQGIQHTWQLDLPRLLPGLPFYPRVSFQKCILSPATWIIRKDELIIDGNSRSKLQEEKFTALAERIRLPRYFLLSHGDQYIAFDREHPSDVNLFVQETRSGEEFTLKERFFEPMHQGTITNERGETYANQLVAAVVSTEPTYPKETSSLFNNTTDRVKRTFITGSEWLYYKLYCPAFNSNEILVQLNRILKSLQNKGLITQWFFIRYLDPEPHLRVRIKLPQNQLAEVIQRLYQVLNILVGKRKISRMETGTYERELERYSALAIIDAENLFAKSTAVVLSFLSFNAGLAEPFAECLPAITVAWQLIGFSLPGAQEKIEFISRMQQMLFREFGGTNTLKRGLDQKKRELRTAVDEMIRGASVLPTAYQNKTRSLLQHWRILPALQPGKADTQLLADLLHMHINRAFSTEMRLQELTVYTLLLQHAITAQKRDAGKFTSF